MAMLMQLQKVQLVLQTDRTVSAVASAAGNLTYHKLHDAPLCLFCRTPQPAHLAS